MTNCIQEHPTASNCCIRETSISSLWPCSRSEMLTEPYHSLKLVLSAWPAHPSVVVAKGACHSNSNVCRFWCFAVRADALSQAACHLHRFRHQQAGANFQRSAWEYLHRVQHRLTKPVCTPCACIGKVQRHTTQKPVEMWPQVEINQILGWTSFT